MMLTLSRSMQFSKLFDLEHGLESGNVQTAELLCIREFVLGVIDVLTVLLVLDFLGL